MVSIHAPARGATAHKRPSSRAACFNPRARAGRDGHGTGQAGAGSSFNPRARAGRDWFKSFKAESHVMFQSTRPRGARQFFGVHHMPPVSFNPRARAGRDLLALKCF